MSAISVKRRKRSELASFLAIGVALACPADSTSAQITPDNTMGEENSTLKSTGAIDAIDGGATRGANQFHSFREFNVDEGRAAIFTSPAGIENILTRVTGTNLSKILGTLGVTGSNANLFLINPNGIIFGANARLDVGGSFVATTANAIGFGDRGIFSATSPENVLPLLTVNPSALLFDRIRTAAIQNNSVAPSNLNPSVEIATGLRVRDGSSLLLVGGDINMDGGKLSAFGGRIELGGLADVGVIGLNGQGHNLSLSFLDAAEKGNVFLSNGAIVRVTSSDGGSIAVNARNLQMTEGSGLRAGIESNLSGDRARAGNIEINVAAAINLKDESFIRNWTESGTSGQGGNISIAADTVRLEGGAQVNASTYGAGKGGNLTIHAANVELIGTSPDESSVSGLAASAEPNSSGNAGDLMIHALTLRLEGGAQTSAATFGKGKGGNLTIHAANVELIGTSPKDLSSSAMGTAAQQNSKGDAGDLTIYTRSLRLEGGAVIDVGTFGEGKGGNLTIHAANVELIGTSPDENSVSGLFASTEGNTSGNAGDLTIYTRSLRLEGGAQVGAGTFGAGKGGNLTIHAADVQLSGISANGGFASSLFTSTTQDSLGNAGDMRLNADSLSVRDGAEVTVQSFGNGTAGNMKLDARFIHLDSSASLLANTQSASIDTNSEQATIKIHSQNLFMSRNSNILTNAKGQNVVGGNINIDTDILIARENSDIRADSANFRGGNVRINAFAVFGTQFRAAPADRTSDITATGASPQLSGTVELDVLDIEPGNALVDLLFIPVNTELAQNCTPSGTQDRSEFTIAGRGGLPPNPTDVLSSDAVFIDWIELHPIVEERSSLVPIANSNTPSPAPAQIVEAQGWVFDPHGKVILTASATSTTQLPTSCY